MQNYIKPVVYHAHKTWRLGFLFLISLVLISCEKNTPEKTITKLPIVVKEFSQKNYAIPIQTIGRLSPKNELKLGFKTGGIIRHVWPKEGSFISKGSLIAQLDLQEVQSYVNQAKAGMEKAKRDLDRANGLYQDTVASLELLQNAQTAYHIAENQFKLAQFNLDHSSIIAPSDGWMLKQIAFENEIVGPGYPIVLFGQKAKDWRMKVQISDRDLNLLHSGDTAFISFSFLRNVKFQAVVHEIGNFADPYTGTFEVDLWLVEDDPSFVTGLLGDVEIIPQNGKAYFFIPPESIFDLSGRKGFVYVFDSGKLNRQEVIVGGFVDSAMLVIDGLPNEPIKIVTKGTNYVQKDSPIQVVSPRK